MKAVILAGGLGTRLSEETHIKPKPMVTIGQQPILWHILKCYSHYGINEFIICAGYRGYAIKEYFLNYLLHMSDVTYDIQNNQTEIHNSKAEPWKVTIVDTGDNTQTGGRLKQVQEYVQDSDCFCLTYGDGLSDINIAKLIEFHKEQRLEATLTAVQQPGKYGTLILDKKCRHRVVEFREKPAGDGSWISGGFFVLSTKIFDRIEGAHTKWEEEPLESLATDGQLGAYYHNGFWQSMDTLREKTLLEEYWNSDNAPWKTWK